jgi:hypothetical protein
MIYFRHSRLVFLLFMVGLMIPIPTTDAYSGEDPTLFVKQIRDEGWTIPGIVEARFPVETKVKSMGGKAVTLYKLKLAAETITELELYACEDGGNVRIRKYQVSVMDIYRFECNGRTFAYLVLMVPVITEPPGRKTYVAGVFRAHYIDENGDGKFETRSGEIAEVPSWVFDKHSDASSRQMPGER